MIKKSLASIDLNLLILVTLLSISIISTMGSPKINYCRPGRGDYNNNGILDLGDIRIIEDYVRKNSGAFFFGNKFDVNIDGYINHEDVIAWTICYRVTCIGDVNLDGVFDSSDVVSMFETGCYQMPTCDREPIGWGEGDFNGDGKFDTEDLVLAFQAACYVGGPVSIDDLQ